MSRTTEPIVISGAGVATCLGLTRRATWAAVRAGQCGMRTLTALESTLPPEKLGGQALDLPADYRADEPREVRYLSWTIREALQDAGLLEKLPYPSHRCGIMLGTTLHGMRAGGEFLRRESYEPLRTFLASHTLSRACAGVGADGFAATTCSACSSSLGAIALGMTLLEAGELDLVIAGGYDTISEYVYGGFSSLRLVADGPLRPFAKNRQGMKLAEGYGIVILERADDARRRSANTLATILGCGESADAHHLTQPHPQGEGAARAIEAALKSADLSAADIDLIAAHATGTPDNDTGEYAAFKRVFGERLPAIPVVAFKSHLGHTLGGAGAVELILSAMALAEQVVPPCANSGAADVEFEGLNLATRETPAYLRTSLNTSLGFGGANTAAVLSPTAGATRASLSAKMQPTQASPLQHTPKPRCDDVFITGIGVIMPEARQPAWRADSGAIAEDKYIHLLNTRRVRRMSEYVKLTLAATALALADAKLDNAADTSVILGSTHGSADFSATYYRAIVRQGLIGANPVLFAEGVPNAAAAHLSLMLGLKGACQTMIGSRSAGLDALHLAALRIRTGEWDRAIVGAGEEYSPLVNGAYGHCGLYCGPSGVEPAQQKGFVTGAAAVTFVLEGRRAIEQRGVTPRGQIIATTASRGRPNESIESATRVLEALNKPNAVLTSAAGFWADRAEAAAIRRVAPQAVVSSLYGHAAEHFSASPLLAIASVLQNGKLPRMLHALGELGGASGDESVEQFGTICTDFTGCVSGALVARL